MDWFQATTTSLLPIMMPPPAGAPSTCFFVYYFVDGDKLSFILYNNIYEKNIMLRSSSVGHCHVCQFVSSRGRVPYPHIYNIFRAVGAESVELYMVPFGLEDGAVVHH